MTVLEMKPIYLAKGKWTAALEERYNASLLKQKRQLFADFEVPFPKEIEIKFADYVAKGSANADVYLDNLCQSYIQYALDHYAEIMYNKLIAEYDGETIFEREMHKIIGKYATKELIKAGLVECCGSFKGNKLYAI